MKGLFQKIKEVPVEEPELSRKMESEEHQIEGVLREMVTLYYFQELKLTEIADILHISLPFVKYRLKQARLQLEKLL